jgi:hypothetical protein
MQMFGLDKKVNFFQHTCIAHCAHTPYGSHTSPSCTFFCVSFTCGKCTFSQPPSTSHSLPPPIPSHLPSQHTTPTARPVYAASELELCHSQKPGEATAEHCVCTQTDVR